MNDIDTSGYAEAVETPDSVDFGAPRVRFKWATPEGDKLVAHIARVSNPKATLDDPAEKLIKYLIRHRHWSPFEMVNLCLEIHTERDISAQILRHSKEFRFQEFSTRYAEVEDLRWSTECRFQDHKNRQNSITPDDKVNDALGRPVEETVSYFDAVVNESRERSLEAYRELLERGVAKECARRVLPIGLMPTVMYINSNLRGWIHYLAERTKPGVQKEHREIALAVEPFIAEHFPMVWDAVIADRADAAIKEWKVEQFDHIGAVLSEFLGKDWHERHPNTGLAEALRLNLCRFKYHPETEENKQ
jgi:thymidylate synthase (FAD)